MKEGRYGFYLDFNSLGHRNLELGRNGLLFKHSSKDFKLLKDHRKYYVRIEYGFFESKHFLIK